MTAERRAAPSGWFLRLPLTATPWHLNKPRKQYNPNNRANIRKIPIESRNIIQNNYYLCKGYVELSHSGLIFVVITGMLLGNTTPQGVTTHSRTFRAGEFLHFIATHRAELWRAVKKNITYDPDLFDDAMVAAVVKVYNAIESGRDVADFKQYFFMAAKWEYINTDNATRRKKAHNAPLSAADGEAVPTKPTSGLF